MGKRLTRVVTRTGDDGTTGLADGSRRAKNDARIVAMGEVDELNAVLGVAISRLDDGKLRNLLFEIQHDLFDVGAELCQPGKHLLDVDYVAALDAAIAELNADLPELREFILPGGSAAVAALQLARTVCRRVERSLISLNDSEALNPETRRYINRLSDLLFIVARAQARTDGSGEVYWDSKYSRLRRD